MAAGKAALAALLGTSSLSLIPAPALAQQPTYTALQFDSSTFTGVTGIRGDNMTGNYAIPNGGGPTGGLLYRFSTGAFEPFPVATASGVNFPGATTSTPYGPTFGAPTGILRVVGSYTTPASAPFNLSFLYDGATAPGQQITTLAFPNPPGDMTKETIAHSTFGNQVVGNYDTRLATGNAFIYDIPSATYTTNNRPGATSTTAYGVWGNRIAGGTTDGGGGGLEHGYIYNQNTGTFTLYDAPGVGTIATHFEGITAGGRAGEFNLVADSVDANGVHAWAVHVDANGVATWTELKAFGALTSGNSIYQDTAIGIFVDANNITRAYVAHVPGLYNPITNTGTLTTSTPGSAAISAVNGDDVVNRGTIVAAAANSVGVAAGQYGVITNTGSIGATGARQRRGPDERRFRLADQYRRPDRRARRLRPPDRSDGGRHAGRQQRRHRRSGRGGGGPFARFQNSGWMGISAPGAGVTHAISGVFAQTSNGTLALRVGNGVSDQLVVNGQARLAGTALAAFQPGALGNSYTLLQATGGYTGTFNALATQNLPGFLSASLSYGTNNVSLFLQSSMASTPGLGGNQISVARALDTAFNAGPGLGAMPALFGLSQGQLPPALSLLAGDNASVGQSVAFAAGGQFTSLLSGRAGTRRAEELAAACKTQAATACAPPSEWGAWASGFGGGQWLNADSSTGSSGVAAKHRRRRLRRRLSRRTADPGRPGRRRQRFQLFGVLDQRQRAGDRRAFRPLRPRTTSSRSMSPPRWPTAASTATPRASLPASATPRRRSHRRSPASSPAGSRSAGCSTSGSSRGVSSPSRRLPPCSPPTSGRRAFPNGASTQSGSTGVFALNYQPQYTASLPTFLGAQLDGQTEINGRPLKAWLRAAWVHEFMTSRSVTAGFTVLPGSSFVVDGARAASDAARLDLGVRYAVGSQTSLYANANVELSDRGEPGRHRRVLAAQSRWSGASLRAERDRDARVRVERRATGVARGRRHGQSAMKPWAR